MSRFGMVWAGMVSLAMALGCSRTPEGSQSVAQFGVGLTATDCPVGYNVIEGTEDPDTLNGTSGNDCIVGLGGDDVIDGLGGSDFLIGGDGNDTLRGGSGNDTLYGEAGNDRLEGGVGLDILDGGEGDDSLAGESGNDTLSGGLGNDTLDGGIGQDALDGGDNDDVLLGGAGDDMLRGQDGNDQLDGGVGVDDLGGGLGNDMLSGGPGADTLSGDDGDDLLAGGVGADALAGDDGNDVLNGGAGADALEGGEGDDVLSGDAGGDTLNGGPGNDQIAGGAGGDSINGGDGNDIIDGGAAIDAIFGGDGNDVIEDSAGDIVDGGTGNDACTGNECEAGPLSDCSADSDCALGEHCLLSTGTCVSCSNDSDCDDGDACTQSDTCEAGACVNAYPVVCTVLDECHEAGICDPATGMCSNLVVGDGTPCSDGNACTAPDSCQAGVCEGALADGGSDGIPDCSDVQFEIAQPLSEGNGWLTGPVALADMNGDGNPDVVSLEVIGEEFVAAVRLGQGDGTFGSPLVTTLSLEGGQGIDLEVVDANADGALDVVAAYAEEPLARGALAVVEGNGTGSLSVQRVISLGGTQPQVQLAVLDVDQNALLDAVVSVPYAESSTSELRVYHDLAGIDEPPVNVESLPSGYWIRDVAAGDMDGDNLSDAIVLGYDFSDPYSSSILVRLNDGAGALVATGTPSPLIDIGTYGFALALWTTNNDSYPDIVAATANGVVSWSSTGPLSYAPPVVLGALLDSGPAVNGSEERLVVSDLDLDGNLDIAFTGPSEPIRLLFGNGLGDLSAEVVLDGGYVVSLAGADLNHDGAMDLVTGGDGLRTVFGKAERSFAAPELASLVQTGFPIGPLDLDGDVYPDFIVMEYPSVDDSLIPAFGADDGTLSFGAPFPLEGDFTGSSTVLRSNESELQDVVIAGLEEVVALHIQSPDGITGSEVLDLPDLEPFGSISLLSGPFAGDPTDELLITHSINGFTQTRLVVCPWEDGTFGVPATLAEYDGYASLLVALNANGDENRDFLLMREDPTSGTGSVLELYFGQNDGTFTIAGATTTPIYVTESAAGDLTGDGRDDLVIASSPCYTDDDCVLVLRNAGNGSFVQMASFAAPTGAFWPAIDDFNNDGFNDLVFAEYGLTIVPGTPTGLGPARTLRGVSLYSFVVSDITLDGKLDLVAASYFGIETVLNVSGTTVLSSPYCGDGIINGDEACDDDNVFTETECPYGSASCTVCSADCSAEFMLTSPYCGDGVINGDELCDDGNAVTETECPYGTDTCIACTDDCSTELALTGVYCGDEFITDSELCDDGNAVTETECPYGTANCTACSGDCSIELALTGRYCGDGAIDAADGETCDDGNNLNGDGCTASCVLSVIQVSAGDGHTCMLLSDASVKCWGAAPGNGSTMSTTFDPSDVGSAIEVLGVGTTVQVDAGHLHSCAVLGDGRIQCWGYGQQGQLGNADTSDSATPVLVSGINTAVQVAAGAGHTCAVLSDGTIACWGQRLANGSTSDSSTPLLVDSMDSALHVSAGGGHTCAILNDGGVACWGYGASGRLGNGGTSDSSMPVLVSAINTAVQVVAGVSHSCAVLSDGNIRCWGYGQQGQLGNGDTSDSATPVVVSGINTAVQVVLGYNHTCALLSDGSIQCWGAGDTGIETLPVVATDFMAATQISAGSGYTCALLTSDEVQCIGNYVLE